MDWAEKLVDAVKEKPTRRKRAATPALRGPEADAPETETPAGPAAEKGGGVQSLARAFSILEEIARARDGITLVALSKRVGLHNSTAFHLTRTMVSLGYIRQDPETKKYRIGRPLFVLASSSLDEVELVSLAEPFLEELSRATGESAHLAIRSGDEIVIVARTAGTGAFQLTSRVGVARPAHATALGKVFLATMKPSELESYIKRNEPRTFTPKTLITVEQLQPEIDDVRRSGVAFDDSELDPEIRCVAVPVRDFAGRVTAAIGISGPVWRLSLQTLNRQVPLIKNISDRLSQELGYRLITSPEPGER
jgi:DNA-binding IclR family transcriptional regulator